jgi:hypothetical protein
MAFLIALLILAVLLFIGWYGVRSKEKALRAAPPGSTRIESVKASSLKSTVAQYARAGWAIVDQSSAKSFGSQARVTITFRKRG